jgi:DNA-binding HxlR family transcriptional regulator
VIVPDATETLERPATLAPPETPPETAERTETGRARSGFPSEACSIAGTLLALGDTWSILVLRELFFGVRRFNDMQHDLGISRSVLTDRLTRLVDQGIVRTEQYQEPGERARHQYRLTRKGVGLLPVMVSLMNWGDEHVYDGAAPVTLHERASGERVRLELRTESGRLVQPNEMMPRVADQPISPS